MLYDLEICTCEPSILLVDDNEFNIMPVSHMIKNMFNIKTMKASNGLEAVEMYHRALAKKCQCNIVIYKMIFMDIQMPIMNGKEAAKKILAVMPRSLENPDPTHIVALTSYSSENEKNKCLALGMKDVYLKPISKTNLKKAIQRHFYRQDD